MSSICSYPSYIGPTDQDRFDQALSQIATALLTGTADFLLGAGMSYDGELPEQQRVPMGTHVGMRLLDVFFPPTGTNPPSQDRLHELLAAEFPFEAIADVTEGVLGTRRKLAQFLKEALWDPPYQPTPAHHDFHTICNWGGGRRVDRVFTTNFDKLLQIVFGAQGVIVTEENAGQIRKVQGEGRIPIIYLHGSLDQEFQITETDLFTQQYKMLRGELHNALHAADAFVFVGYSMRDPDFRRIYMEFREELMQRGEADRRTYFVAPAKDEYSYRLGTRIWEKRGATWFPVDANTFFGMLRRVLESHEDKQIRTTIMQKYNIKRDSDYDDLVQRTSDLLRIERIDAVQFLYDARTRLGGAK